MHRSCGMRSPYNWLLCYAKAALAVRASMARPVPGYAASCRSSLAWTSLPLLWTCEHRPHALRVERPPPLVEVTGFGQPGADLAEAEPLASLRARPPQPPGRLHGLRVHLGERFASLDFLAGGLTLALAGTSQLLQGGLPLAFALRFSPPRDRERR